MPTRHVSLRTPPIAQEPRRGHSTTKRSSEDGRASTEHNSRRLKPWRLKRRNPKNRRARTFEVRAGPSAWRTLACLRCLCPQLGQGKKGNLHEQRRRGAEDLRTRFSHFPRHTAERKWVDGKERCRQNRKKGDIYSINSIHAEFACTGKEAGRGFRICAREG